MNVTPAVWFKDHKYPPSTTEQVLSWWTERTGATYMSRECVESAQAFVTKANRDVCRPLRCHAHVLHGDVDVAVRCSHRTAGVHFCLGEYFCSDHLPKYTLNKNT